MAYELKHNKAVIEEWLVEANYEMFRSNTTEVCFCLWSQMSFCWDKKFRRDSGFCISVSGNLSWVFIYVSFKDLYIYLSYRDSAHVQWRLRKYFSPIKTNHSNRMLRYAVLRFEFCTDKWPVWARGKNG